MHLISLLLFILSLNAKEISVSNRNINYKINYNDKSILYEAPGIELSLEKRKCNKYLFESFNKKINFALKQSFSDSANQESYLIKIDLSSKGNQDFFINFDNYFKQLKIEELLSCQKFS
jgi:hypothetical protein